MLTPGIGAMTYMAKNGPKIVAECRLPVTAQRRVDLVVTDLAVIQPTREGLLLLELAPGVTPTQVISATVARLLVPANVPEMTIGG